MSVLLHVLAAALACAGSTDQVAASSDTLQKLSRDAERELASSVEDLNRLREKIAADKLPLSTELSVLEGRVAELRHRSDDARRSADGANLELAGIKSAMKLQQDELDYVGNLLDEYAKTFETKINPCESQSCGAAIEAAKLATGNDTLEPSERYDRQIALVSLSAKRIGEALGGMRVPGVGVDLQGAIVEGQYAVIGPVALFASKSGAAGLAVAQSGSTKPLVRPLEDSMQAGMIALVQNGEGLFPLDPSRGGALKALVQKTNIVHVFEKGGPIMWPLLVASILALGTVIERLLFLANERRKQDRQALESMFEEVQRGNIEFAARIGQRSKYFVTRALSYALEHKEQSLPNALAYAQARELKRFRRGIPILDTVITLAPLLGLLGTVTGMMSSFSLIGGELNAPGAITGGIAEALIATAFGLGIAITALLPFNFLNARLDEATHEMESAAAQLELLVRARAAERPLADHVLAPAGSVARVSVTNGEVAAAAR